MDGRTEAGSRGTGPRGRLLLAVCLGIDGLVLWLLLGTDLVVAQPRFYARSVEQAIAEVRLARPDRIVVVRGVLVSGSLVTMASCETRFRLRPNGPTQGPQAELVVVYGSCELPQTFCDLPEYELNVRATGRLSGTVASPVLRAVSVLASCPTNTQ